MSLVHQCVHLREDNCALWTDDAQRDGLEELRANVARRAAERVAETLDEAHDGVRDRDDDARDDEPRDDDRGRDVRDGGHDGDRARVDLDCLQQRERVVVAADF